MDRAYDPSVAEVPTLPDAPAWPDSDDDSISEEEIGAAASGRHRLWELEPGTHCSVIGTCLGLDDLRRLIRKAALTIPPEAQDYEIHGYFVARARSRSPLSKLLHKMLDRKYAAQIARFRRASTIDEILGLWGESKAKGDLAGAYWALMTHPAPSRAMRIRAQNEVHMLSHLMGRSSRDEFKRLSQLEAICTELTDKLAKARARADAAQGERDTQIRALETRLAAMAKQAASPPSMHATMPASRRIAGQLSAEAELDKLRLRFASLQRRLKVERARARAAEEKIREREEERRTWPVDPRPAPACRTEPATCDADLAGCALLYVGGHPNIAPHLRDHVERMHGRFLYHDGGVEEQTAALPGLVSQADAVFCPVGCVSHDACLRLKHLCRQQRKRFILLRSAGLSSFVKAVKDVVSH